MDERKREALEAAGFRVGDAADFLGLSEEERRLVELRVAVSRAVRRRRTEKHLTQKQLATKLRSSQSRVAKLESCAGDVTLDLMFRGLFAVGGDLKDLGTDAKAAGVRTAGKGRAKAGKVRTSRPQGRAQTARA
jgi:predicted XRE-type DNA-binding protein